MFKYCPLHFVVIFKMIWIICQSNCKTYRSIFHAWNYFRTYRIQFNMVILKLEMSVFYLYDVLLCKYRYFGFKNTINNVGFVLTAFIWPPAFIARNVCFTNIFTSSQRVYFCYWCFSKNTTDSRSKCSFFEYKYLEIEKCVIV